MLPEQTINNMTFEELKSYSETFSEVPAVVVAAMVEKMSGVLSELQDESNELEKELSNMESDYVKADEDREDLITALNDIDIELDEEVPDYDEIKRIVSKALA